METKHTPGPWRATSEGYVASESNGYVPLRTPFRPDAFVDGTQRSDHTEETLQANARLIAAAPKMAGALKAILFQVIQGKVLERDACITQAREALKEAGII